jgi:hypothetical protein
VREEGDDVVVVVVVVTRGQNRSAVRLREIDMGRMA